MPRISDEMTKTLTIAQCYARHTVGVPAGTSELRPTNNKAMANRQEDRSHAAICFEAVSEHGAPGTILPHCGVEAMILDHASGTVT